MRKKHIVGILWEQANDTWFSKDMCAYPYYLADKYDWNATLCYFVENESLLNLEYQKKVSLVNLGCETNYKLKLPTGKTCTFPIVIHLSATNIIKPQTFVVHYAYIPAAC